MQPLQIAEELNKLSLLLPTRSQEALNLRTEYEKAKVELETYEAHERLNFKATCLEDKEADLRAKVKIASNNLRLELVIKESKFKALEVKTNAIMERINCLKVIGKIVITELINIEPQIGGVKC